MTSTKNRVPTTVLNIDYRTYQAKDELRIRGAEYNQITE